MHFKLFFCIVLLQLLRNDAAWRKEKPKSDEDPRDKKAGDKLSHSKFDATKPAVVVDLTHGRSRHIPDSTRLVRWMTKPISWEDDDCKEQGVLQLVKPYWFNVLTLSFTFRNPKGYSINIGDSINNNAWGGDGSSNMWDGEIHNYHQVLYAWGSQYTAHQRVFRIKHHWLQTALMIRIYGSGVYITNYEGFSAWYPSNSFFKMHGTNSIFIGLNRVIKNAYGDPFPSSRNGSGLCTLEARWNLV